MEVISKISKYIGVQGVYAIININKCSNVCNMGTPYVGQAMAKPEARKHKMGVGNRLTSHLRNLRNNVHKNSKLQNAWNKYGDESFIFIIIERVDDLEHLTEREQYWIDEWKSYECGYNLRPIADSSWGNRKTIIKDIDVVNWVKKYKDKYGKFPHHASGKVEFADEDITWSALEACLINGWRGLPKNTSLSKLIAEQFNVINRSNTKKYSNNIIRKWIERHYKEYGYYPTKRSGVIEWASEYGYNLVTWDAIDRALRVGVKGLSGGSSLSNFIKTNGNQPFNRKCWKSKKG